MTKAVAVMADGKTILFETVPQVEGFASSSTDGFSSAGESAADLAHRLERINQTILGICRSVHDQTYNALSAAKPKEFEIEFGITLSGEAGIPLVTKGSAEAALKVIARW